MFLQEHFVVQTRLLKLASRPARRERGRATGESFAYDDSDDPALKRRLIQNVPAGTFLLVEMFLATWPS
jgi:hypothetical protein